MMGKRAVAGEGSRAVTVWLWCLVALVIVMVSIGGATRLTGSGLSITEWRPVTGAIPPLSDLDWTREFARYRDSSQYENLTRGMSLGDFKAIYWWEWGHRQLGRTIGLVFFLPLVWFWWRGALGTRAAAGLLGIGALGGLQAAVGWIMVASGLEPGMVAVAPVKLTLHLLIASLILALLAAAASRRGAAPEESGPRRIAAVFLGLVVVQIALGGLVAGSKAGLTYNTWPLMDGRLVPPADALFVVRPLIENAVDNPALVQFNHRLGAYALVVCALAMAGWTMRTAPGSAAAGRAGRIAALALGQMALGIATLILEVPLWAGLAHQALAMLLLVAATHHLARSLTGRARPVAQPRRPAAPGPALARAGGRS